MTDQATRPGPLQDAGSRIALFEDFHDLLRELAGFEEIGTEDVLAAVLPLMRQTLEWHEAGKVGPFDGVEALKVFRGRIYAEAGDAAAPRWNPMAVSKLQGMAGALDMDSGRRQPFRGLREIDDAEDAVRPLPRGATPDRPGHLPDYRCWEHAVGNHDPLTDIYSLGMIAGSLAVGLDFTEPEQLETFLRHRERLTQLNKRLHPVAALTIRRMTEPDRRNRAQDLGAIVRTLETHRRAGGVGEDAESAGGAAVSRDVAILTELRGRLYDLSRRNKLLHHRASGAELNLTEASTPIVLRADAIRPEQLFTWSSAAARRISAQETVSLSEFIRFEEMDHAPATLDRIRAQARKDRAEFGFSQLRLVIAFLSWRNLKDDPETPITSPLLLLPVELKKRRGVRDSYELRATAAEAEVNPTLRRCLKILYDVELPATASVSDAGEIAALAAQLAEQVAATEPGVRVEMADQPDIRALHERALRRVDVYKRRARPAGGAARRHGDLLYSYNPAAYRPLGLQLYRRYVEPSVTPAQARAEAAAADAQIALPLDQSRAAMAPTGAETTTKTRRARPTETAAGPAVAPEPHLWLVDLCSVTLANFNYRKMSLVRDFDALIDMARAPEPTPKTDAAEEHAPTVGLGGAFDQLFNDGPKPIPTPTPVPPIAESWQVVASDPTQEAAIGRSRRGESYVIQGPPGTGKSQTIANLIADYVGRGKRVLFVCEKRAAIDVVYNRLEALGLHRLCARVHDSQEDKKAFVLDLKHLHESWLDADPDAAAEAARREALETIARQSDVIAALREDMTAEAEGAPIHELVGRAAEASRRAGRLNEAETALLPSLADWRAGREAARSMEQALSRLGSEPILARHPARFVSAEASADPQLFERLSEALDALGPHLERMEEAARHAVWSGGEPAPLSALFAQIDFASRLAPLAAAGRLDFMQPESNSASRVRQEAQWIRDAEKALAEARLKTQIWSEKLSPQETEAGIQIARRHEGKTFGFLSRAWKETRAVVAERANFAGLAIKPKILDVLQDLWEEHVCADRLAKHHKDAADHIGVDNGETALALAAERDGRRAEEGAAAQPLFDLVRQEGSEAAKRVETLANLKGSADAARAALAACFEGLETLPVDRAFAALSELRARRDALPAFAPALRALSDAPETVRAALRRIDAGVDAIEEAIVDLAVERAMVVRPALREASGAAIDAAATEIDAALARFRTANAAALLDRQRQRFVEHMQLTQRLDLELDPETQKLRRAYVDARQDLDRELAKSQRFRSVRELMAGPAGLLVRDLKPIWLMSPLSVADVLPLDEASFDVAIFDEASQVPVEEAAPTLFRAGQVIVVGDEKQLPPTNFFGVSGGDAIEDGSSDGEDEGVRVELDAASFLAQAARTLPSTLLGWHYRSRSEELIAFSNAVFYAGKLISVPSARLSKPADPIIAEMPEDGARFAEEMLDRAVSFHHTPFGVYEKQKNPGEALYVAEAVRRLLLANTGKSLGVVAFSEAQQTEIERSMERLAKDDAKFRDALEAEYEREEDGRFEGLFVKNLENVQGDERDIVIVSVCYAPDKAGRMRMNFGPINRAGGEKRLNVIFSRARAHLALVSTITGEAITNDYNTGALCLKTYLRYAEAASKGDRDAMRRALASVAPHATPRQNRRASSLAEPIAAALRERGLQVETGLGESRFVCDLAVRAEGDSAHKVAVLIDGPEHYEAEDPLERTVTRPAVLRAFGWRPLTVLALDWRRDPEAVIARIVATLGEEASA